MTTTNPAEAPARSDAQAKLNAATLRQLTFKPGVCRAVAVAIMATILESDTLWPDHITFNIVGVDDRNVIGTTWRRLRTAGLIAQTGEHRPSEAPAANGRIIWQYRLVNSALARTFLSRNGAPLPPPRQQELFR